MESRIEIKIHLKEDGYIKVCSEVMLKIKSQDTHCQLQSTASAAPGKERDEKE